VIIHANVKSIGREAFRNTSVEKVVFEEGSYLESIDTRAFRETHSLRSINIPSGVIIQDSAFHGTDCGDDIFTPGATIEDCQVIPDSKGRLRKKKGD